MRMDGEDDEGYVNDILEKGVDDAMTANRGERKMTLCLSQIRWDKARNMMMMINLVHGKT